MVNEPLKAVSNVIELSPDKEYLLVFEGVGRDGMCSLLDRLKARGIRGFGIALYEGQSLQVIEREVSRDISPPVPVVVHCTDKEVSDG